MALTMGYDKKPVNLPIVTRISDVQAMPLLVGSAKTGWRQYPAYSKIAAQDAGAEQFYLQISDGDIILGLANVRIKKLPILPLGFAMITHGPTLLSTNKGDFPRICEAVRAYLVDNLGLSLKLNPAPDFNDPSNEIQLHGFEPIYGSEYETFFIDLNQDLDLIRKNFNGKWRTDLNRGQKGDVRIISSSKPQDFFKFEPILSQLAAEKGFNPPQDAGFFARIAEFVQTGENIVVHLAYQDDRVIGGHIGAYSGNTAVYLLGATNAEGRNLRASFLLQWAAIIYAKNRGQKYYDLGGVDEANNPDVYRFKKRMGGAYYKQAPMVKAHPKWPKGILVDMIENLYQKIRR